MFYDPHIQQNIYTFVHRERFHPGKNVIEKNKIEIFYPNKSISQNK